MVVKMPFACSPFFVCNPKPCWGEGSNSQVLWVMPQCHACLQSRSVGVGEPRCPPRLANLTPGPGSEANPRGRCIRLEGLRWVLPGEAGGEGTRQRR